MIRNDASKPIVAAEVVPNRLNQNTQSKNLVGSQAVTAGPIAFYNNQITTSPLVKSSTKLNSTDDNQKVIVKLSDLHPLIIGKLGAECTCKIDPNTLVQSLQGQNSSRYDLNKVYVELDESQLRNNNRVKQFMPALTVNRFNQLKANETKLQMQTISPYVPSTTLGAPMFSSKYLTSEIIDNDAQQRRRADLRVYYKGPGKLSVKIDDEELLKTVESPTKTSNRRNGKSLNPNSFSTANLLRYQDRQRLEDKRPRVEDDALPEGLQCARPGLFRHPKYCDRFYVCHWDQRSSRYVLNVYRCSVHLSFDKRMTACNWPLEGPSCQDDKLLV